jgi:hypothetical protein
MAKPYLKRGTWYVRAKDVLGPRPKPTAMPRTWRCGCAAKGTVSSRCQATAA